MIFIDYHDESQQSKEQVGSTQFVEWLTFSGFTKEINLWWSQQMFLPNSIQDQWHLEKLGLDWVVMTYAQTTVDLIN